MNSALRASRSVPSEGGGETAPEWSDARFGGRRITLPAGPDPKDGTISFSIPGGVDPIRALIEVRRSQEAVARGHSRRIVSIDGPPRFGSRWFVWAARVAMSYAERAANIVVRATVHRGRTLAERKRISQRYDGIIAAALASPSAPSQPGMSEANEPQKESRNG